MCHRHSAWKEGTGIFLLKPGKESYFEAKRFRMITLTSFQLKCLERLIPYHIKEDTASQYGFCACISTETAVHEFVGCVEPWPPKQQGLLRCFEKGDDVIASSPSGEALCFVAFGGC